MNTNKIFMASYDHGLTRAERNADGSWAVEHLMSEVRFSYLAMDPFDKKVVYAGTQDGVLVSKDTGKSWNNIGLKGVPVKSLVVSPHQPGVVYAGGKPVSLYVSQDYGESWEELPALRASRKWWWFSPADPPGWLPYVQALTISPRDPNVMLAGIELGGVLRSEDGGKTWSKHLRRALRDCHSLKTHATNGEWVYEAGGTGGGASLSQDGGKTWQKAKRGLAKNYGIVCAADPEKPEIWYVCVGPSPFNSFGENPEIYLYRSNAGAGWKPIGWNPHPLMETPTALVTSPDAPGGLYAGLKNGDVWHTADYGDSWDKLPFNLGGIWYSLLVLDT
jgi:photosystem II stability/assembly factor-like uncharacterized protein